MTQLDVMYRYGVPPGEAAMMALARIREVYGIRGLVFDEAARSVRIAVGLANKSIVSISAS